MVAHALRISAQKAHQDTDKEKSVFLPCLPLYPPVELLHSFGYCPIVLWNLKSTRTAKKVSESHLQNYVCSVAMDLLDVLLEKDFYTGNVIFSYNACDTLRNLPEIIQTAYSAASLKSPEILALHIPVNGFGTETAKEYFTQQMQLLIQKLESQTGRSFCTESFSRSVNIYRNIRKTMSAIEQMVANGEISYRVIVDAIKKCAMLPPEEQQALLGTISSQHGLMKQNGIPIIISGILPPPDEVIGYIEDAGLRVAVNDIAAEGRSYNTRTPEKSDPVDYYVEFYESHHPCTTLLFTADRRIDELVKKAEERNARGCIFIGEKFCEYEYFEIVHLEEKLKERGIFVLQLEFSRDDVHYSSMKTRIDAFAELLNQ